MFDIGVGLRFPVHSAGGLTPEIPTVAPLPIAATARWHPQFSQVAISGGRVVTAADLQGMAGGSEMAPGAGPQSLTDGLGRKFWRFEGDQALVAANDLVLDRRAFAVFMVLRSHRAGINNPFFGLGTDPNAYGYPALEGVTYSRSAAKLRGSLRRPLDNTAPGAEHMVVGSQLQLVGVASRGASSGQQRLFHNANYIDVGETAPAGTFQGALIGAPRLSGTGGNFDVYDIVVYTEELSDAQCADITAALQAGWSIPDVTNQLVLEGDSITQGTGIVTPALNASMVLTEPGSDHIPASWRVTNYATSGNKVPDMVLRRDAANGWPELLLPGQNIVAFEIGRNDQGSFTEAEIYQNIVSYLNTAESGLLQRGWTVRALANIAGTPAGMPRIEERRANLRNPQFLLDTMSGSGQAYDGLVSTVSTDLIEHNGETRFEDSADAANAIYYAGDSTHPSVLGAEVRVTGGDTPQYGVAAGL